MGIDGQKMSKRWASDGQEIGKKWAGWFLDMMDKFIVLLVGRFPDILDRLFDLLAGQFPDAQISRQYMQYMYTIYYCLKAVYVNRLLFLLHAYLLKC